MRGMSATHPTIHCLNSFTSFMDTGLISTAFFLGNFSKASLSRPSMLSGKVYLLQHVVKIKLSLEIISSITGRSDLSSVVLLLKLKIGLGFLMTSTYQPASRLVVNTSWATFHSTDFLL